MLRRVLLLTLCALTAASSIAPYAAADHESDTEASTHDWQEGDPDYHEIIHTNRWRCEPATRNPPQSVCIVHGANFAYQDGAIAKTACTFEPDASGNYTAQAGFDCGHSAPSNGGWVFLSDAANHTSTGLPPDCINGDWHGEPELPDGAVRWTVGHCGEWVERPKPVVSISGVSVSEDAGIARLPVTVSGSGSGSVNYATANGTATSGDYTAQTASLPNLVGGQSYTVNVPITDDSSVEGPETFTVTLSGAKGVDIGTATATVTIIDNDTLSDVSISGAAVTEGGTAVVTVASSGGNVAGTVNYATVNGSATAPSDYTAATGTLAFSDTQRSHQVRVPTNDDTDDESTETFTVRLSGASNVVITTAVATVNILDNDDPPAECPDGYTGNPPNCVPNTCPVDHTGTPPNCVPIVASTGCDAPGTRLGSLSVTVGGTNVLSGFSATTYSYAVTVDASSGQVTATTSDPAARVRIGLHVPSMGSASRTVSPSAGSTDDFDVVVYSGEHDCTYTLEISRPGAPATDCPAYSGQRLVGGVCVEVCPDANDWPVFGDDGEVWYCQVADDCPWDLMGFDPSVLQNRRFTAFDALWVPGVSESDAVAAGSSTTVTRRAAKCPNHITLVIDPLEHDCVWRQFNIGGSDGDCLSFSLAVEAFVPAVEADSSYDTWEYRVGGCGHNHSAPRFTTWTADDATCSSTDTSWKQRPGYCVGCSATAPTEDAGEWEVTLGTLTAAGTAYVDVPLEVSVTDWGDASHLQITVVVTQPTWSHVGGAVPQWQVSWSRSVNTMVTVPRQSGPPPSDDVVEVNIAEVAALPYTSSWWGTTNRQFVEVLRSGLLANDGCPIGADCTDPLRWPVEILGTHTGRCTLEAFAAPGTLAMQPTEQGLVGCDNLNNDSSYAVSQSLTDYSARYWPRMWASGEDSFRYRTYGGEATVTIRFTDRPPAAPDITAYDPGTAHTVAQWGSGTPLRFARRDSYGRIIGYSYYGDYARVLGTDVGVTHHAGLVDLSAVRDGDSDGDLDLLEITDANNAHLSGPVAVKAQDSFAASDYSYWRTQNTTSTRVSSSSLCGGSSTTCYRPGHPEFERFLNSRVMQPTDTTTSTTLGTRNSCTASSAATHRQFLFESTIAYRPSAPATLHTWSSAAATDPGCIPEIATACTPNSLEWHMCYAVWPQSTNPAPLVVDYRACDDRLDAASRGGFGEYLAPLLSSFPTPVSGNIAAIINQHLSGFSLHYSFATAEERETAAAIIDSAVHSRFCSDGTITVVLGDMPTVSVQPTASATEGSPLEFMVMLDTAAAVDVTVNLSVLPDTTGTDPAEPGDYDLTSDPGCRAVLLPVTIPAGQDRITVRVCTTPDTTYENDETLRVRITGANLALLGVDLEAVGSITNDDNAPTLQFAGDETAAEDDGSGTGGTLTFAVELVGGTELWPVTVTAQTVQHTGTGAATATATCGTTINDDYVTNGQTLIFSSSTLSNTFTVMVCADTRQEPNETFGVELVNPSNTNVDTTARQGTIEDNDQPGMLR